MHNAFGSGLSLPAPVCLILLLFFVIVKGFFALGVVVGWIAKSLCYSEARVWIVLIRLIRGMIRSHYEIIMNRFQSIIWKEGVFFPLWWVSLASHLLDCAFSSRSVEEWPEMALNSRHASYPCEMQDFLVRPAPGMHQKPGGFSQDWLWLWCWWRSKFTFSSSSRTGRRCCCRWYYRGVVIVTQ